MYMFCDLRSQFLYSTNYSACTGLHWFTVAYFLSSVYVYLPSEVFCLSSSRWELPVQDPFLILYLISFIFGFVSYITDKKLYSALLSLYQFFIDEFTNILYIIMRSYFFTK